MASTSPKYNHDKAQILQIEEETPQSPPKLRPASRRTSSFSSSSPPESWDSSFGSSSFSFREEFPPFSPSTPLKFKGIPFSWEKIPGIPKHQCLMKKESSDNLLPLPPAGNHSTNSSTKKSHHQEEISPKKHHTSYRFQRDPFYAALVECSKDNEDHEIDQGTNFWKGSSKISRNLSDRFGFINMYTSCKRTCAVSESIVYLPRSTPHDYLLNRRSR